MRKLRVALIAAGLLSSVILVDGLGAQTATPQIEQPLSIGKVKIYSYHCSRKDSCDAFCNRDEILIGGGCAIEQPLEGRATPALQNAWISKQEHTGNLRYDCAFQGPAKMIIAQSICIAPSAPGAASGASPGPVTPAPSATPK
jgi:hypothetical protein